jgi:hypothetical protein
MLGNHNSWQSCKCIGLGLITSLYLLPLNIIKAIKNIPTKVFVENRKVIGKSLISVLPPGPQATVSLSL